MTARARLPGRVDLSWDSNWKYLVGLGRVTAGAVLFSLPILMTMEMWRLGFYLARFSLVQFAIINFIVLVGLSRLSGFERTTNWGEDLMDALAAYGIAALWSLIILWMFGIVEVDQRAAEIFGKVIVETIPASFGAMIASKQMGSKKAQKGGEKQRSSYWGQLFLMLAGALFLGFSVAPTEEMILISYRMFPWQSIVLIIVSILLLHGFVYTVGFKGEVKPSGPVDFTSIFLRFSVTGYAIAALTALYLLWTFGRLDGTDAPQVMAMVAVLAFPGAIGAAIARLVI